LGRPSLFSGHLVHKVAASAQSPRKIAPAVRQLPFAFVAPATSADFAAAVTTFGIHSSRILVTWAAKWWALFADTVVPGLLVAAAAAAGGRRPAA
jgi:hypothetical protein